MTEMSSHDNHLRAEKKHEAWLEEIERWRADHRRALATLDKTAEFIRSHEAELDRHATAIREHQRRVDEHEASLAEAADDPTHLAEHRRMESLHLQVLEEHNRFRGRHLGLIKEILQLEVALHKASHQPA